MSKVSVLAAFDTRSCILFILSNAFFIIFVYYSFNVIKSTV